MKRRRILALMAALILLAAFVGVRASAADSSAETLAAFRAFCDGAAGRYACWADDDMIVVEAMPAFGRLLASVAYCAEDGSAYSFYGLSLTPDDLTDAGRHAGDDASSFALNGRAWSIMSNAGQFWPEEYRYRISLTDDGFTLANLQGGSGMAFLRLDDAPTLFPYGLDDAAAMAGAAPAAVPEGMAGDWSATWRSDGVDAVARLNLGEDGLMTALIERQDGQPPLFIRGGYALTPNEDGTYGLTAVTCALGEGAMPGEFSASLSLSDDGLAVSPADDADCPLLPDSDAQVLYERGPDPLHLAFMTLDDPRDGQKFFDVTVRDPLSGEEEYLTVLKDGGTVFGWSSGMNDFDLMILWQRIRSGRAMPVLYHERWGCVDLLLILNDIAENTDLLMARAPYFTALRDYQEDVPDGSRRGGEASIFFDKAGEPTIALANRTDYAVQREMTARIVRRVGEVCTAVDDAGNSVVFEIQPYGCLELIEQNLSFATNGFPGFGTAYYQKIE